MATQRGQIFVGRQREMAELKAALDSSMSGRGRIVMLAGEPGIGKTRTATELAAHAKNLGAQVHWGWCYEGKGAPPYWPWVQAIRSYAEQRDASQTRTEMGPGAADIAEMVPELRAKLPDLEALPALEPEQARFRLFDSTTTFLMNAAESQPMVLVLDDLHWADQPSLMLLEFLARQMAGYRLLVLGCYRDTELSRQHPLSETLAQLSREPIFQRQVLRGLSQDDTEQFLEEAAGTRLGDRTVEAVYTQTEGNPFFMSEIIRLWSEQGDLTHEGITGDGAIRIPEGVREVIGRRLNRLSSRCNEMLTTASVVGREFGFKLLNSIAGTASENELIEALEEALAARVVEELPDSPERYQFTHALIQETLSGELSAARRVRLHAKIGEALEELYGVDAENHAAELAHHFVQAEPVLGPEKLVRYSLLAGEQALVGYAYEEASAHFQQGIGAKQGQPFDDDTAKLWAGLGRCQVATLPLFQLEEAVASLSKAFDYYVKTGNADLAVAIAEHPFPASAGRDYGVMQIIERALALVPPDSRQAGRLLARYGWLMGIEKANYEESRDPFARAMNVATNEGDTVLAVRTLVSAAEVEAFFFQYGETITKGLEAIALLDEIDDPQSEMLAHFWVGNASLNHLGDLAMAKRHINQSITAAERLRHHFYLGRSLNQMSWMLYRQGEWQAARDFNDRGLAASPRETRLLHTRIMLENEVGNFSDGVVYLERLLEVMRLTAPGPAYEYAFPAMSIPMAARISGNLSWLDEAVKAANHVFSSLPATPMVAAMTNTGLALLAVQRGDVASAKQLYLAKQPPKTFGGLGPQINRLIGLLAQTAGSVSEALAHFEDALGFCRNAGFRPELAWTCHDYADALWQRNNRGDRVKAATLLDEALAISSELGMRPLMERVVSLQTQTDSIPTMNSTFPDGLTMREVEVLRLVARGSSNREIAAELVLSDRTVERHLTNIYSKISARGRADATAYALGHDLFNRK